MYSLSDGPVYCRCESVPFEVDRSLLIDTQVLRMAVNCVDVESILLNSFGCEVTSQVPPVALHVDLNRTKVMGFLYFYPSSPEVSFSATRSHI
jgi:hypothetical protein